MTRYEILHRFAEDERTHRDHAFTFHVLTELWAAKGQPDSIELDLGELLRILKTKRSTVFRWLAELEQFGYIIYRRAKNQHEVSTVTISKPKTKRS